MYHAYVICMHTYTYVYIHIEHRVDSGKIKILSVCGSVGETEENSKTVLLKIIVRF